MVWYEATDGFVQMVKFSWNVARLCTPFYLIVDKVAKHSLQNKGKGSEKMTSIKLTLTGAVAKAEVTGALTAGMVGVPVTIAYDEQWEGLTKSLVCRSGAGVKTILHIDTQTTVAPETLQWVKNTSNELFVGVEGRNADGDLVLPSTMAYCGKILPGADPEGDPAVKNAESVWTRVLKTVKELENLEQRWKSDLAAIINEVIKQEEITGGYYSPSIEQVDVDTVKLVFSPSRGDMPLIADIAIALPKGENGAKGDRGDAGTGITNITIMEE